MSNSNRESIVYEVESTWGTTPGAASQLINFTDTTLGQTNETQVSNFIRSDTNRTGTIRTNVSTAGNIGIELQYAAYDDFITAALRSAYATALNVTDTGISAAASDNSINGTGLFGNAVVGQWIRVSGFTGTPANNGYMKIISKPSNDKIIVAGKTLVDDAAGESVTIKGQSLKNGSTDKSFSIERQFNDITQFVRLTGLRVSEWAMNFSTSAIATGSFSFVGKNGTRAGSTQMFGSPTAASTAPSMNTIDDVVAFYIDNTLATESFTNVDFTVSTNAEALRAIGTLGASQIRTGSIGVTGTLGFYFEDATLYDKLLGFTEFALAFVTEDEDGNAYVFDFPSCRLTTGNPDNPGIDQTITIPAGFESTLSDTYSCTLQITKIPA